MQRKLEGSRIFTSGVHLGTLWANTDTWSCGMPRVSSGVLSCCALTDIQFQGSCSKLTLYQCYWWVSDSTELMVTKFSPKLKKKKKKKAGFSFILARSSSWLNTSAVFPLKTQNFGWCENLCQEMPPREQNVYQVIMDVITGSNICLFFSPLTLIQPW